MASNIYYNVYYSTTPKGPWTLSNSSPMLHSDVNTHTVTGLKLNVQYYFLIIGGILDENNSFVPLISQPINPEGSIALGVGTAKIPPVSVKTFAPTTNISSGIGHQFEIDVIIP